MNYLTMYKLFTWDDIHVTLPNLKVTEQIKQNIPPLILTCFSLLNLLVYVFIAHVRLAIHVGQSKIINRTLKCIFNLDLLVKEIE
jgi:hypothetical protein